MNVLRHTVLMSTYSFRLAAVASVLVPLCSLEQAHAVVFVDPDNLQHPTTGIYDEFYVPPQLLRPTTGYMAMVGGASPGTNPPPNPPTAGTGGASGVVIGPHWVLTARHVGTPVLDSAGNEISRNFVGKPIWINGVNYRVDSAADQFLTDALTDLALLRITAANNSYAQLTEYASIDPNRSRLPGEPLTQGGFSNQLVRDNSGQPSGDIYIRPGLLTWGRNYITQDNISILYSAPEFEEMRFQGTGWSNDSGGGYFVRDGWDWRLIATTIDIALGLNVTSPSTYDWIDQTVGGLPQAASSARPAATVLWGGGTASWHNAANWEDANTHQARLPGYDHNYFDAVEVVSTGEGPTITGSATARDIFVGVASTNYSQMTIKSNGALVANTIFAGADVGEKGVVSQLGGTVAAEVEYIGYRGAIGGYFHQAGSNDTLLLCVGKDNNATDLAAYHMRGSNSPSGRPMLSAKTIEIGGSAGANGLLLIEAGTGSLADINAGFHAIVGARGHGEVVQEVGSFSAGHLYLGRDSTGVGEYSLEGGSLTTGKSIIGADGDGTFTQTNGTHSTGALSIGSGSSYSVSGGELQAGLVEVDGALTISGGEHETGLVEVDGTLTISGGELATNKVNGEINFANSTATIRGEGFVDLRNASFLNSSNANLVVEEETLVLLASANPFNTTQIGSLTPHIVGSTLNINADGFRVKTGDFLGHTLLPDHVEFTNEGFANVLGDGHLGFMQGARVYSSSAAPITAWLSSGVGSMDFAADGSHLGLEVDAGATLRADGKFDFGDALQLPNAGKFHNAGRLEIGGGLGAASIADLEIIAGSALTNSTQFELANSADLVINIDRDVTQLVSDTITVEKARTVLSGNLSLVELSGFQAAPKEQFTILTTDLFRLEGAFSSITVDDGDPATNAIFTNTSGGLAAYAVIYTDPNTDFRSSVDVRVSLPGDFDLDDDVDAADSAKLFSNWGMTGATWTDGDANGDGVVNGGDFTIHQANVFRSWPSFSAVPEAHVLSMTLIALLPLIATKRKQWRNDFTT